jgi:hypothetical protein
MSSLSRRACFKCGNVGHYAGMLLSRAPWLPLRCCGTRLGDAVQGQTPSQAGFLCCATAAIVPL